MDKTLCKVDRRAVVAAVLAAAFSSIASPIRSMLGADGSEIIDSEMPTAADYIQDGLVCMWDGIENAGYGLHDDEANTWVDLTGHGFDLPIAGESIMPTAVRFANTHRAIYDSIVFNGYAITMQCVIDRLETTGNFCILGFGFSTYRIFTGSPTGYGCRFGSSYSTKEVNGVVNSISMFRDDGDTSFYLYNGEDYVARVGSDHKLSISSNTLNINGENPYGNYRNVFSAHCIRLYNRTLSPDEIKYNYLIDKIRFDLP